MGDRMAGKRAREDCPLLEKQRWRPRLPGCGRNSLPDPVVPAVAGARPPQPLRTASQMRSSMYMIRTRPLKCLYTPAGALAQVIDFKGLNWSGRRDLNSGPPE